MTGMAQTRKQKVLQEVKRQRKQRTIISLVIAAVLISIIGFGVYALARSPPASNFPFPCLAENTTLHIHPWLRIVIQTTPGGQNYSITIPTAVGILDPQISNGLAGGGACFEPLHTHDDSGIIHVESAHTTDKYTLGDFFNVWKATPGYATIPGADTDGLGSLPVVFNSTDILGFRPDQTHTMSLLVDVGQQTYQNSTAYGSLSLIPLDYCSAALASTFPCSATAGGDPYFGGATYTYGTGHTIIIYYKAV
jgi:hypothetical protein